MGALGLQDKMSPTLRGVLGLLGQTTQRVAALDRAVKQLGGNRVNIRVGVTGDAPAALTRIERQLTRVGQSAASIKLAGVANNRAAAALMGPSGSGARVIQMNERRQQQALARTLRQEEQARQRVERQLQRDQERVQKLALQAQAKAARQAAQEQARFQREQERVQRLTMQAQARAARQAVQEKARFQRDASRFLERRQREEARMANQQLVAQRRAEQLAMRSQVLQRREQERTLRMAETRQTRLLNTIGGSIRRFGGGVMDFFTRAARGAGNLLLAPFRMLGSLPGLLGFAGVGYGMVSLVKGAINFSAQIEQAQIAFTTMLGDAQRAKAFVGDLFQFAAKTPFEFPDVTDNARKLLAMDFQQHEIIPWLTSIGNAVSALGASQEVTQRVILAIGQIRAKGKLMGEEIRQLAEVGIPVVDILSKKLGMTKAEIMKGGEAGITAERALSALFEGLNEKFKNGMVLQSKSWTGLWTTIKDNTMMILGAMGDGIRMKVQPRLLALTKWFEQNPEKLAIWKDRLTTLGYRGAKVLVDAFEGAMDRLNRLFGNPKFLEASFGGKMSMVWDELVVQPFAEWWAGPGKAKVGGIARGAGAFVGDMLGSAVKAAFGLDSAGPAMMDAGSTAGQQFVEGFIEKIQEVDWGQVFTKAFKGAARLSGQSFTMAGKELLTLGLGGEVDWGRLGLGVGGAALTIAALSKVPFLKEGAAKLFQLATQSSATAAASGGASAAAATGGAATGASALATAGTYGLAALLGWNVGSRGVGPALAWLFGVTDEQLPGGNKYRDNKLKRQAEIDARLRTIPAQLRAPEPSRWDKLIQFLSGDSPALPSNTPVNGNQSRVDKREITLNVNVTRAEAPDDESLAEFVARKLAKDLEGHLANS